MNVATTPAFDISAAIRRLYGDRDPGPSASREILALRKRLKGKRGELILVAKTEEDQRTRLAIAIIEDEELDLSIHFCAVSMFRLTRHVRIDTDTEWRPQLMNGSVLLDHPDVAAHFSGTPSYRTVICIGNDEAFGWLQRAGFPSFDWPRGDLCRHAVARYELLLAMLTLLSSDASREPPLSNIARAVATHLATELATLRDKRNACRAIVESSGNLDEPTSLIETIRELRRHATDILTIRERIIACGLAMHPLVHDILART